MLGSEEPPSRLSGTLTSLSCESDEVGERALALTAGPIPDARAPAVSGRTTAPLSQPSVAGRAVHAPALHPGPENRAATCRTNAAIPPGFYRREGACRDHELWGNGRASPARPGAQVAGGTSSG